MSGKRITGRTGNGDLPLILFTSCAVVAAGIAAGQPLLWLLSGSYSPLLRFEVFIIAALLGFGILTSLAHLGRKERMLLAARRTGRSPLSTEVALALITFVTALWILIISPFEARILTIVLVTSAFLLLLDMGFLYRLGGQLTWRGASVFAPLVTGLLWGSLVHAALVYYQADLAIRAVFGLLALDTAVTLVRWWRIGKIGSSGEPRDEDPFTKRNYLIFCRIILTDILTLCSLLIIGSVAAIIPATAGVFLDRYLFYSLGVQHTTESEISRIESVIREIHGV